MRVAHYDDQYVYRGVIEAVLPEGGAQRWVYGPYRTRAAAQRAIDIELRRSRGWFYVLRDVLSTRIESSPLTWGSTDVSRPLKGARRA